MTDNKRVLVIKMSPVRSLDSSMMRAAAMIRGILEAGYTVDMLTIPESATHVLRESGYGFMEQVNIITAGANRTYDRLVRNTAGGIKQKAVNLLRRIYHRLSVANYIDSIAKKVKLSSLPSCEYEYIISVSDPKASHVAARALLRQGIKYSKLIEYWGDPLYGDITLKSVYPGFVYRHIEKKLLAIADKIIYTSPFTLECERKLYPRFADRMSFTPTAYTEEKILPRLNHTYTVGYYGAYTSKIRNIVPLYEACRAMAGTVNLKIIGNSDIQLEPTGNIEIGPRGDIGAYELETDLFVCILNRSGTQIPGKLYHYAAYNRPVLVVEDGDTSDRMHRYILSLDRYYTCGNDAEEIKDAVRRIMSEGATPAPSPALRWDRVAAAILS